MRWRSREIDDNESRIVGSVGSRNPALTEAVLLQQELMVPCWIYSYFWIPGVVCVHSTVTGCGFSFFFLSVLFVCVCGFVMRASFFFRFN